MKTSLRILLFAGFFLAGCAGSLPRFTSGGPGGKGETLLLEGEASFYGQEFAGRETSSGEPYDPSALTAAHRSLPFNTRVRVTNQANGLSVVVRVNDRGPWKSSRIIDVSMEAASRLNMLDHGTVNVRLDILP